MSGHTSEEPTQAERARQHSQQSIATYIAAGDAFPGEHFDGEQRGDFICGGNLDALSEA